MSSYNHKESSVALWLTVDPSPPAPSIASSAPADGRAWFASTPSSGPLLRVDPVSDVNYKAPFTSMNYRFSVATTPGGAAGMSGNVTSLRLRSMSGTSTRPVAPTDLRRMAGSGLSNDN